MKIIATLLSVFMLQTANAQLQEEVETESNQNSLSLVQTTGVQIGELAMGGSACPLAGQDVNVRLINGRLQIPLLVEERKLGTEQIGRGTCAFTLPISVDSRHRLILSNMIALGNLNLNRGTSGRVSLEVFSAVGRGQVHSEAASAQQKRVYKDFSLTQSGQVVALECGQAINLRGNASVLLQGQGKAYGNLSVIQLQARIEACR